MTELDRMMGTIWVEQSIHKNGMGTWLNQTERSQTEWECAVGPEVDYPVCQNWKIHITELKTWQNREKYLQIRIESEQKIVHSSNQLA